MSSFALFAARQHDSDPTIALIGLLVLIAIAAVIAIREFTARYDVILKGSLPHCPKCLRQVTYRRDCCRACGYQFKTHGQPSTRPTPAPGPPRLPARPGPINSPRSTTPPGRNRVKAPPGI